jgi:ABC-type amino acid transport system permease subunit
MTPLIERLSSDFLPLFLRGMVVNFEIAVIALAVGLALGLLLAFARLGGGVPGGAAASVISVMRAAPTFVVMFFLLNAIPRDATLFGAPLALSGVMTVALSLVPYSAAYIADAGADACASCAPARAWAPCCSCPTSRAPSSCWSCRRARRRRSG